MIFTLTKTDGKIGAGLVDYIKQLPDGKYRVEIDKFRISRSNQQNKLYWAYLRLCEEETGNEANDLHEYFKRKFLPPQFKEIMGETIKLPATTTKLNKTEFGTYLDKISFLTSIPIPTEIII
jgi:hypothetical protein